MSAVNTITNRIVIAYGADTVAEMGAGGKAGMIVAMVVMAIALGVQPMFAYLYGAGNTARLRETFRKSGILAISLGIVLLSSASFFRFPICGLFLKTKLSSLPPRTSRRSVSSACRLSVCITLRSTTSSPSAKRRRPPCFPFCGRAPSMYRFCFRSTVCSVFRRVLRRTRRRYLLHTFSHLPPLPRHKERSRLRKAAFARKKSKNPSKNQLNFHILSMTFFLASVILLI